MNNPSANSHAGVRQALVLSGGGARAAYQVGCLRHIAQVIPEYRPKILTGVSAGAINAVHLAAYRGEWLEAVERLRSLWLSLETEPLPGCPHPGLFSSGYYQFGTVAKRRKKV